MTVDVVSDAVKELAASIPNPPGPENPDANIAYRREIVAMGDESPEFAAAVNYRCSQDVIFWFNTFVWTQNPKDFPQEPHRPVILFPLQADFIVCLHDHVERGEPLLLEKSREQLASVGCANYALWRLLYCDNSSCLVGSKKEALVEGVSYAKAIFPKIDYSIKHLPKWLLPEGWSKKKPGANRKKLSFTNHVTGMSVEGETCNADFARSGRFAWVWLDEVASVERQEEIHAAVANTTNCFVYTTTPKGLEMFARMVRSGDHDVFCLHWTKNYLWHPEGYKPEECQWNRKEPEKSIWPEEWVCKPGCRVHGNGGMPHSQRYDRECNKLKYDQAKIAQELDIEYSKSGGTVFDADKVLAAIKQCGVMKESAAKAGKKLFRHYKLSFDTRGTKPITINVDDDGNDEWYRQLRKLPVLAQEVDGGPLRVYREPFSCRDKECICGGSGLHVYVLGGDPCQNLDGDSHCGAIWDATAGHTAAEWHGQGSVEHVSLEWAKLCKWYGTSTLKGWRDAWAAVEANNNGADININLVKLGIFVPMNRQESNSRKKRSLRYGIVVDKYNKPVIINNSLQPEIDNGDAANPMLPRLCDPFVEFWLECQTYVYKYNDKQENRPTTVRMEAQTRKDHDDRVMSRGHAIYFCLTNYGKVRGYIPNSSKARNIMWQTGQHEQKQLSSTFSP